MRLNLLGNQKTLKILLNTAKLLLLQYDANIKGIDYYS